MPTTSGEALILGQKFSSCSAMSIKGILDSPRIRVSLERAVHLLSGSDFFKQMGSDYAESSLTKSTATTVLLVEPQRLLRSGLELLVNSFPGFVVSGSVACGAEALAELSQAPRNVILSEVALQGSSGIDLLLELQRQRISHPKVLLMYSEGSVELIRKALLLGAHGCLSKQSSSEELLAALVSTSTNRRYIAEDVMRRPTVADRSYDLSAGSDPQDPLVQLSRREREIFYLLAHGNRNTDIAKRLFISPRTVETHRSRIVQKLGFESNAELIRFAFKSGLIVE